MSDDLHATYITGTITLSDGSTTSFSIAPDLGWQQWGNYPDNLGSTVDLVEAMAEAGSDYIREAEDETDEDEEV